MRLGSVLVDEGERWTQTQQYSVSLQNHNYTQCRNVHCTMECIYMYMYMSLTRNPMVLRKYHRSHKQMTVECVSLPLCVFKSYMFQSVNCDVRSVMCIKIHVCTHTIHSCTHIM